MIQSSTSSQMVTMFPNYNHKAQGKSRTEADFTKFINLRCSQSRIINLNPRDSIVAQSSFLNQEH